MLVKDYMTRHPIMIEPHKRVFDAQRIMTENQIRHLPVVGDGKRLLGLLTRQRFQIAPEKLTSLEVWEITRFLTDLTVERVMVKGGDLRTIDPEATLEDAADIMIRHKIGALPVVEDDMVVGILTETDLLIELQNLLGANDQGWRVTVRVPDRRGEASKLMAKMLENGWGIMAMGGVRSPKQSDSWDIVLKVRGCTKDQLRSAIEAIGQQQIIDIREAAAYANYDDAA